MDVTNTQFLWFIFGAWTVLLAFAALTLITTRPGPTSFRSPMVILGMITGGAVLSKTGSIWWTLAVAAMAVAGGLVLGVVSRRSAHLSNQ